jgi:hypothetical protein
MIQIVSPLLLLCLVLCGCSEDVLLPEDRLPLRPLVVGNVWIGSTTIYDTSGSVRTIIHDTLRIESDTMINGERWFATNKGGSARYITNRPDGFWLLDTSFPDQPWRDIKQPAQIQEVCSRDTFYVGAGFSNYFVHERILLEKGRELTVPAGTFTANCYSFMQRDSQGHELPDSQYTYRRDRQWIAPGIGHIRTEDYSRTTDGREYLWQRFELTEVHLK